MCIAQHCRRPLGAAASMQRCSHEQCHHAGIFYKGCCGDAQALWLGVEPPDLLLYVFLPPILLDSAARIDFFVFKKARACSARRAADQGPRRPCLHARTAQARTLHCRHAGGGQLTGQGARC